MLTQPDVARYLLERKLITAQSIVEGDLVVRDASSRNRNFRVERTRGPSYLLKQATGNDGSATVGREAAVYRRLAEAPLELRRSVPVFHGYDDREHVLILELVPHAVNLRDHQIGRGRFSVTLAGDMGGVLGRLHRLHRDPGAVSGPGRVPWVLSIHRPGLDVVRESSLASIDLIKIVQSVPEFGRRLDEARESWRAEALIHHDVKWDNFITVPAAGSRRLGAVKLVDWEAAGPGDPCWDIGSLLAGYLSTWLFSIPVTGRTPPADFPALARHPLSAMQPAVRKCWATYVDQLGLASQAEVGSRLVRAVAFAGARLVLTAFEAAQMMPQLTGDLILHLQLGLNVLQRTREAAAQLLGLSSHLAARR